MRRRGLFGLVGLADGGFGRGLVDFRPGHREFRESAIAARERVVWTFPEVDPDVIWRQPLTAERAAGIVQMIEREPEHRAVRELWRIFQAYRESLMAALVSHERRHNLGKMPEVAIVRPKPPRFAIQHVAQCAFADYFYRTVVDATEEDRLINAPGGQDTPEGA